MRIIKLALLCLTAVGGVASADDHRDRHEQHARVERHAVHNYGNGYNHGYYNRGYVQRGYYSVNRSGRPYWGHRYYNYYRRPALIVEDYAPLSGYMWVRGHWYWGGVEWLWEPGHYAVAGYGY